MVNNVADELKKHYPAVLVDGLINAYCKALREFRKHNWQYVGNEIGQFVEILRRIIEFIVASEYTPLDKELPKFTEKELSSLEQSGKQVPSEYRIIIPRCLYSMYCIRSKRGIIHKSRIDPNKMDATLLVSQMKWIFAELFRLASSLPFDETLEIVDSIIIKETELIWDSGNGLRILDTKMIAPNKVLCLLYYRDNLTDKELQKAIEYKNTSVFKKSVLKKLHTDRLIDYSSERCKLSPLGINKAEELINKAF